MPITPAFTIVQDSGGTTATATNTTPDYGGSNPERSDGAEFVLWSKTDKEGARSFNNPDQGNVLTKLVYTVETPVSGLYELIWLRIPVWDSSNNYLQQVNSGDEITQYPSIVYYPVDGKVYKCIQDAPAFSLPPPDPDLEPYPTNTLFWVEVPLDQLVDLLGNTEIQELIKNFNSIYAINKCITGRFAGAGCSCSDEDKKYNADLFSKYVSATSNYNAGNIYKFEEIIADLNVACPACS